MKQVFLKKGEILIQDVPYPKILKNSIIVDVHCSMISKGTELGVISVSKKSIYQKIAEKPERIKKAIKSTIQNGIIKTYRNVTKSDEIPLGYSCAGIVVEKDGVDIKIGERVACAGSGFANHAEFVVVPKNLFVRVPDTVSLEEASTVAIGSIALQGIRRAKPEVGETIVVYGVGIIGFITLQILNASGVKVIGIEKDDKKIDVCKRTGFKNIINPAREDVKNKVRLLTDGYGADATIITASSQSSDIINEAIKITRKKGRIIIVGNTGMNIEREELYYKESDVLISTSYGPGRYDENYELKGIDYPLPYIRWTENRNMEAYLKLIADKKIDLSEITKFKFSIENAKEGYEKIKEEGNLFGGLITYKEEKNKDKKIFIYPNIHIREEIVNLGVVGTGSFFTNVHLENIMKLKDRFFIKGVVDVNSSNLVNFKNLYKPVFIGSSIDELLNDESISTIFITTRHNLHSEYVIKSLKAGKNVFVEKPLCLNMNELNKIVKCYSSIEKKPVLMVGFNRRFSPFLKEIKRILENRTTPIIIKYIMNAGYIPSNHWIFSEEGGGRNIGEAVHIYDLFTFLCGYEYERVMVQSIKKNGYSFNDNFIVIIYFKDGSICSLIYTSMGSEKYQKERMEVFVEGKTIIIDDYIEMKIYDKNFKKINLKKQDKGHYNELLELYDGIKGSYNPIPFEELVASASLSFEVEEKIGRL